VLPHFVLVVCLAAAQADISARIPEPLVDTDAYQVYAAIILPGRPDRLAKARHLVITDTTATYPSCFPSGTPLDTEWKDVAADFKKQNATIWSLRQLLPLDVPYELVRDEDIQAPFGKYDGGEGWETFYRQHPDSGGYFRMSAVGFNRSRTRAMVYLSHACGGLCGEGRYHFLERVDGVWLEKALRVSYCFVIS
jgi:hypothetical protein